MTEEVSWRSIDELLAESKRIHFAEVEWKGKKVKIAWKELEEGDEIPEIEDGESLRFQDMTVSEKSAFLRKLAEAELVARVKKAGENAECLNSNMLPMDTWKQLPLRLRAQLISVVFEYDRELRESFLSQPKTT